LQPLILGAAMQSNKPPYTLQVFDGSKLVGTAEFCLEPERGIVARQPWINVSAVENLSFTVKSAQGESLTLRLFGYLKGQCSNDRFTMTVQGTQGFHRRNVAFTVFVNPKKSEVAA
jgi:hypothetical protein